jgi:hypothetical protein
VTTPKRVPLDRAVVDGLMDKYADLAPTIELVNAMMRLDADLPIANAFGRAQDYISVDRSLEMLKAGVPFIDALQLVGSYGKINFMIAALKRDSDLLPLIFKLLPKYWPSADPDDTSAPILSLWKAAYRKRGNRTILDNVKRQLPQHPTLVIYRGQPPDSCLGIAWSLSIVVARKFAHGASTRKWTNTGEIVTASIPREKILAYLTERNEEEIICDPVDVLLPRRTLDHREKSNS